MKFLRMPLPNSIRTRHIGLILIVVLPMSALIAVDHSLRKADRVALANASVRDLAVVVASSLEQMIVNERAMLAALAARPAQRIERPAVCDPLLAELLPLNPYHTNIVVGNLAGEVLCSAVASPGGGSVSVAGYDFIQRIQRTGEMSIGEPIIGPFTGRWVVPLAVPRRDAAGALIGWAGAPLDAERIGDLLARAGHEMNAAVILISPQGKLIACTLDTAKCAGAQVGSKLFAPALLDGTRLSWHETAHDGVERLWGVAEVPPAGWKVLVGVDAATLLAPVNAAFNRNALALAAVLLLVVALAALNARAIATPIEALAQTAGRVGKGERSLRVSEAGPPEIARVAREFNHMLDALAAAQTAQEDLALALREREKILLLVTETIEEVFYMTDAGINAIIYISPGYERVWGRTCASLQENPRSFLDAVHLEDFASLIAAINCRSTGQAFEVEYRIIRPDGTIRWILDRNYPIRDAAGQVTHYTGVAQDVTARRAVQAALHASEAMLRLFVDHAPAAIAMFDREMRYLAVSRRWVDDYQLPQHDLVGRCIYEVLPELPERWKEVHRRCLAGATERSDGEAFRRADGSVDWVSWEVRPWRCAVGEIGGIVVFSGIITARKQAEAELDDHRQRAEALARRLIEVQEEERRAIARELHDELGGAFTSVKLNLLALKRAAGAQSEATLADALALTDGAIQTVRSLSLDLRPVMLDDLGLIPTLEWYCAQQAQRSGVAIKPTLEAIDLNSEPAVQNTCYRIVQEAVTNALRYANARNIRVSLRRDDGMFALEIADDGDGFDAAQVRQRGLAGASSGLLGMEERVRLLGGRLVIDSAPSAGTRVCAEFAVPEGGLS